MVHDMYADTLNDVTSIAPGSGVPSLVEEDVDWDLDNILMSSNVDVCSVLHIDFTYM